MEIIVHKGTNKIGGAITEIATKKGRIIIDFGKDLDESKKDELFEIAGLTTKPSTYNAVFITHNHIDHIGWIDKINSDIPVYVQKKAWELYKVSADFNSKINLRENVITFDFQELINVSNTDIFVTSYEIDHSAFASCMFKIEAEGKTVLHTGDFRRNGYKGIFFEDTLKQIGAVDLLITEGTSFSRNPEENISEEQLTEELANIFKDYDQVFVMQSTTNIDRITTVYKAARRAKMNFVEDLYMAKIASTAKSSIPNPVVPHSNLFVYKPKYLWEKSYYNEKIAKYLELYNDRTINTTSWVFKNRYVMNVRDSMLDDIKKLNITKGLFIYSLWDGYIEKNESMKIFVDYMKSICDFYVKHTSGHADIKTVKRLIEIINPKKTIAIHTENEELLNTLTDSAEIIEDGGSITI